MDFYATAMRVKINAEKWKLFFDEVLPNDYDLLSNLEDSRPMNRMQELVNRLPLANMDDASREGLFLYNSCKQGVRKNISEFRRKRVKMA